MKQLCKCCPSFVGHVGGALEREGGEAGGGAEDAAAKEGQVAGIGAVVLAKEQPCGVKTQRVRAGWCRDVYSEHA